MGVASVQCIRGSDGIEEDDPEFIVVTLASILYMIHIRFFKRAFSGNHTHRLQSREDPNPSIRSIVSDAGLGLALVSLISATDSKVYPG